MDSPTEPGAHLPARAKVLELESALRAVPSKYHIAPDDPIMHVFANGVYMRRMSVAAGVVLTGAIHKYECINFIEQGRIKVFTEADGLLEYFAPCVFVSPARTKRAMHIIEDTIWSTVHPDLSGEQDPDKLRTLLVWESYEEMEKELSK